MHIGDWIRSQWGFDAVVGLLVAACTALMLFSRIRISWVSLVSPIRYCEVIPKRLPQCVVGSSLSKMSGACFITPHNVSEKSQVASLIAVPCRQSEARPPLSIAHAGLLQKS